METDAELLRQYVKEGSEAAFGELVRRYLGLVYSAAVRSAGGNTSLAEDVTQAVFIILARQGPSLVGHESLAGWLHTCTRYTTLRALRDSRRRQHRELKAAAMEINDSPQSCWDEVRPMLDEAVAKLSATDRQAVLLRFFQNRSHREVGAALGVSEDAARVRVDRALDKLRRQFAQRGIIAAGALLGETILSNAAEAEPVGLARRVNAATTTAETATLGWGALMLRMMLMTTKKKILIAVALLLVAGLFTLSWPKWAGLSVQNGQLPDDAGAKKIAVLPQPKLAAVQAPTIAPVPVSSSNAVVTQSTLSAAAASNQQPSGITPPPPPLGMRGAGFGAGGNAFQSQYRNFFQKMNLTQDQQAAFLKILNDKQSQTVAASQAARSKISDQQLAQMMNDAMKQMDVNDPRSSDPQTIENKMWDVLGLTEQFKAISDASDARIRQLLGSEEGFQAYQTYTSQEGVRQWVTHAYGNALQSAGVPGLTVDEQEALVGIVAKSLQPGDPFMKLNHVSQVVDQASTVLSSEQIEVLKTNPQGLGLSYYRLHQFP